MGADGLKFYEAVNEYGLYGEDTEFEGIDAALWYGMKITVDNCRGSYSEYYETQSENGKKGGAPKGNSNAKKTTQNNPNQPETTQINPNQPKSSLNDNDNDNKNGDFNVYRYSGGGGNLSSREEKTGSPEPPPPPPPLFLEIKNKTADLGFFFDDDLIRAVAASDIPREWFSGEDDFLTFCAGKLRSRKNAEKTGEDLRRIFATGVISFSDWRSEYRIFRAKRQATAAARAERKKIDDARKNRPQTCPVCGKPLSGDRCPERHGLYVFDEKTLVHEFRAVNTGETPNLLARLEAERRGRPKGESP
jgi:hypothetical protein